MPKKPKKPKKPEDALPKFGGFHPLASGLQALKEDLDAAAKTTTGSPLHAPSPPPRRPDPPRTAPRQTDHADDALSFHRMMSGVTPLEDGGKGRMSKTGSVPPEAPLRTRAADARARAATEAEKALEHLHALVDDAARFEVSDDGQHVEGWRAGTPTDLVRKLRRGLVPIDGRLDLHGLNATEAQEAVATFLRAMRARQERCALIIHGKGERHPEAGVLRGEIAAWLSQGKAREHVTAFATARNEDGGEGAIYVALRR